MKTVIVKRVNYNNGHELIIKRGLTKSYIFFHNDREVHIKTLRLEDEKHNSIKKFKDMYLNVVINNISYDSFNLISQSFIGVLNAERRI